MRYYVFSINIAYNAASFWVPKRGSPVPSASNWLQRNSWRVLGQAASSHLTSLVSTALD